MAGALIATFGFASLMRGEHWAIDEETAMNLAASYVKVGKRLEPYMPAVAAKLGPLAILADIAAAGAVTYVVVKPRLIADAQMAQLRELQAAHAASAPVTRVEPAGIHRESATHLDTVRRDNGATVAETDPTFVDRVAAAGAEIGISPSSVVELRSVVDPDGGPLLDTIAPGIDEGRELATWE